MKGALVFAFLVATASGCVRVKPYQREYLSLRPMRPAAESAEDRFRAHYQSAREGSIGGDIA
jgi:hypothetical protein